jgi:hypothetical protein
MSIRYAAVVLHVCIASLILATSAIGDSQNVAVDVANDHFDFLIQRELVGRYHVESRDGPLAKPYLWPLIGPGGVPMTRAWPMEKAAPGGSTDHPHQKSLWFCHGDVIPEGFPLSSHVKDVKGVDFWSETEGHGRIVCTAIKEQRGGIETHNEWRTAEGQKILDETRTIQLIDLVPVRLFVFNIDLLADVAPITFGDTKEGSFGIRINDLIREQTGKGKLENADGKIGEFNCWGRQSDWCDYSGPIAGQMVGLAIFDDPDNKYRACWHSRGYGLMAANPFGRAKSGFPPMRGRTDLVHMERGEHLKLRYGVLVHLGNAKDGKVQEYYEKFVKLKSQ